MKSYKHSGTLGDLIYGLSMVKYFGPGKFYLHLNQIDWITQHYYGSKPNPFHQGRMTEKDFEFLKSFMTAQDYIEDFQILNSDTEITHNLDRFREVFVGHPGNYIQCYAWSWGINDAAIITAIESTPWLTVPNPKSIPDRPYVINRSSRGFTGDKLNPTWTEWRNQEIDKSSVFVGLESEYMDFKNHTGWELDYYPVKDLLELAEVIAGCEHFIGNQSSALAIAQGLGKPYYFEARVDLPIERNESLFPSHTQGSYF